MYFLIRRSTTISKYGKSIMSEELPRASILLTRNDSKTSDTTPRKSEHKHRHRSKKSSHHSSRNTKSETSSAVSSDTPHPDTTGILDVSGAADTHGAAKPGLYFTGYKFVYTVDENGSTVKHIDTIEFTFKVNEPTTWKNLQNVTRAKVYEIASKRGNVTHVERLFLYNHVDIDWN